MGWIGALTLCALWLALPSTHCGLLMLARSARRRTLISGCRFIEEYSNRDVQVLRCERCRERSVGYFKDVPK